MALLRHLLRYHVPPPPPPLPHLIPSFRLFSASSYTDVAQSISSELTKLSESSAEDLCRHLSTNFSDVTPTPDLLKQVLDLSPTSGRSALGVLRWASTDRGLCPTDDSLAHFVEHLGRRNDFKAVRELISEFRSAAGPLSLSTALLRLARAGRPTDALKFFSSMSQDFNLPRNRDTLRTLVEALATHGFPSHAERAAKDWAHEVFPDIEFCNILIRGWCDKLKLEDARRLMGEMQRGGFELRTPAYNSILDCVCRLCRKRDPHRLQEEAEKVLEEMHENGIHRDSETFFVLIYNLCRIRKTEDAMKLFRKMGEWGCSPGPETYLTLIRSLYLAARVSEGDEMMDFMVSAGFKEQLDKNAFYGFIKVLCGIERVEHAMKVFKVMKGHGHVPGVKTYTSLIRKLAGHNKGNIANSLFREAVAQGVTVEPKVYKVNPRYAKVKEEKKVKKRLTLPEKTAMKRRRLKRIRLSFVKKPRSSRRVI